MSNSSSTSPSSIDLIQIHQVFIQALLDTAYYHGGLLLIGSERKENLWLNGETRRSFFKVGFEAHFVYRVAVFDSLLNSLTSLILCYNPGIAIGDKEVKAGRLISDKRAKILSEYIDAKTNKCLGKVSLPAFVNSNAFYGSNLKLALVNIMS